MDDTPTAEHQQVGHAEASRRRRKRYFWVTFSIGAFIAMVTFSVWMMAASFLTRVLFPPRYTTIQSASLSGNVLEVSVDPGASGKPLRLYVLAGAPLPGKVPRKPMPASIDSQADTFTFLDNQYRILRVYELGGEPRRTGWDAETVRQYASEGWGYSRLSVEAPGYYFKARLDQTLQLKPGEVLWCALETAPGEFSIKKA